MAEHNYDTRREAGRKPTLAIALLCAIAGALLVLGYFLGWELP